MRCPDCGARNPEAADWCSQCYRPLGESAAAPPAARETPPDERQAAMTAAPAAGRGEGGATTEARTSDRTGRFRRVEGELEWRCVRCDMWNAIDADPCPTCGASLTTTIDAEREEPTPVEPEANPVPAMIATALVPGLGHVLLGRTLAGIVRAATYVLWFAGGLLLLRAASTAGQSALPAMPLLAGAAALWITSASDTAVLVGIVDGRELLTPRVFLWLVVGVVGTLVLAFVPTVVGAG